jgi:hypothetical protein
MFVERVTVGNDTVQVQGAHDALEAGVAALSRSGQPKVPIFDREWCQKRTRKRPILAQKTAIYRALPKAIP